MVQREFWPRARDVGLPWEGHDWDVGFTRYELAQHVNAVILLMLLFPSVWRVVGGLWKAYRHDLCARLRRLEVCSSLCGYIAWGSLHSEVRGIRLDRLVHCLARVKTSLIPRLPKKSPDESFNGVEVSFNWTSSSVESRIFESATNQRKEPQRITGRNLTLKKRLPRIVRYVTWMSFVNILCTQSSLD